MFNEVCVSSAYSFVSKKLKVNYGIFDLYRVTAGVVSVVGLRGDSERNDVSLAFMEIFAYADTILVPIVVPLICR